MGLKSRCHRATDGSEMFLLSLSRATGRPVPQVFAMSRADAEDLVYEVSSAVRSFDSLSKGKTSINPSTEPDGGDVA